MPAGAARRTRRGLLRALRSRRRRTRFSPEASLEAYTDLNASLAALAGRLELVADPPEELIPHPAPHARTRRQPALSGEKRDESYVYWIEKARARLLLTGNAIDVSTILAERLFSKVGAIVLTSATLRCGQFE